MVLDRYFPTLDPVQLVRDEAHRFAVTFHRKRRQMRDRQTDLCKIPGVGAYHQTPSATLRQPPGHPSGPSAALASGKPAASSSYSS